MTGLADKCGKVSMIMFYGNNLKLNIDSWKTNTRYDEVHNKHIFETTAIL